MVSSKTLMRWLVAREPEWGRLRPCCREARNRSPARWSQRLKNLFRWFEERAAREWVESGALLSPSAAVLYSQTASSTSSRASVGLVDQPMIRGASRDPSRCRDKASPPNVSQPNRAVGHGYHLDLNRCAAKGGMSIPTRFLRR